MSVHAYDDQWALAWPRGMRRVPSLLTGFGMMCGAVALLILAILILAAANAPQAGHSADKAAATAAMPTDWIDIVRPIQIYDLSAPELAKSPLALCRPPRCHGRDPAGHSDPRDPGRIALCEARPHKARQPIPGQSAPFRRSRPRARRKPIFRLPAAGRPSPSRPASGRLKNRTSQLAAKTGKTLSCLGFRGAALSGTFRISGFACGTDTRAHGAGGTHLPDRSPGFERGGGRSGAFRVFRRQRIAARSCLCGQCLTPHGHACELARS